MITPAGKNRHQVSQGGFKHESFMDNDLFKAAQGASGLLDRNKQEEQAPEPSDELQQAVDDPNGSLGMNPPGADAGQQPAPQPAPQPVPQPAPQQPVAGEFEQAANQIAMKVLEGLNLQPAAWDVNTAVQNQAGQVSAITIKMTRGANMKAVAKATNSGQIK